MTRGRASIIPAEQISFKRILAVTNREPFQIIDRKSGFQIEKTTGGLISALEPAMNQHKGLWVSGLSQTLKDNKFQEIKKNLNKSLPFDWQEVNYASKLHHGFYAGFSNRVLWPLFHSMLNDSMHFHRSEFADYKAVNEAFADRIINNLKQDDLVWIHDYQLCLTPALVRNSQKMPSNTRIGYFLHIPFPPYDLFRTLPWQKEILLGMLGSSLIGFHVDNYCQHFFDSVEQILNLRCDRLQGSIDFEGRKIHVRAMPIGIDSEKIYKSLSNKSIISNSDKLRKEMHVDNLIVGVDRLDYTKGIYKRLRAFEVFLDQYPERHGKVSMMQIAVPSRTEISSYQKLREDIERLVGHINGLYAQTHWTPVTYMCRSLPFEELISLYLAADIGLVTPLRDGMNLVAKEYVAAHLNKPGVLILSDLAGAARQLTEALIVNPYDIAAIAESIELALKMPETEKLSRMKTLNTKIAHFDVYEWVDSFLSESLYVK